MDDTDAMAADLIRTYAASPDLRRPRVRRESDLGMWNAWIPPTQRAHFDTDGWTHLGPYGDSFWPTWREAYDFIVGVLRHCPHCGGTVRREPDAGGFLVCNGCCELLNASELVGAPD